ncbi:hypothetical protein JCM10908_000489 [Rhodotorula pacifica]|uniref:uncharacterized protein n=1 Tax=Rhodotorula pacifica TaxID=1495444 RepID=UPI0031816D62
MTSSVQRRSLRNSCSSARLPQLPSQHPAASTTTTTTTTKRGKRRADDGPSLADLIRAEQERESEQDGEEEVETPSTAAGFAAPHPPPTASTALKPRARRRSSAPSSSQAEDQSSDRSEPRRPALRTADTLPSVLPPPSPLPALLLPPHYGRPLRPSSPDAFAALFRPVLRSLSRPASPSISPTHSRSPTSSHQRANHPPRTTSSLTSAPIDRSSSSLPAQFPPREPTDPAPTVESQGFVLYIGSLVAYGVYLVWAFWPEKWLVAIGIEWYPSRDWALLVPAWVVMLVAFVYISYFLLTMYSTPSLSLPEPYDDPKAYIPPPARPPFGATPKDRSARAPTPLWAHAVLLPEEAIPPLYDLPVEVVERVLAAGDCSSDEDDAEDGDGAGS